MKRRGDEPKANSQTDTLKILEGGKKGRKKLRNRHKQTTKVETSEHRGAEIEGEK